MAYDLPTELRASKAVITEHWFPFTSRLLAEAADEIERLRSELEGIAEGMWRPGTRHEQIISDMRASARKALAHEQKSDGAK